MKVGKIAKYIVLFFLSTNLLFSEGIYLKVKNNTSLYKSSTSNRIKSSLEVGNICQVLKFSSSFSDIRIRVLHNGTKGWVDINELELVDTPDTFNDFFLNRRTKSSQKNLILSYYLSIIKKNRAEIIKYEPFWSNDYIGYGGSDEWYQEYIHSRVIIYNTFISFEGYGSTDFAIKKITRVNENHYKVEAKMFDNDNRSTGVKFKNISTEKFITLILKRDGDYLSIYLDDESNKLCELIQVNNDFIDAIHSVVREEPVDLSKINWPQRASKEKEDTTTKASKKNYYTPTVNRLRFRATPTLDGRFIRHLKAGERLELIERGKTEKIGDAKGTWVKVKTKQGEVGWCFDAYLKEVK